MAEPKRTEIQLSRWLARGAIGGLLAGAVFMAVSMWFATSVGDPAMGPLLMISTILKGDAAMTNGTASAGVGLAILRNTHINRGRRRRPELLRDPESAAAVCPRDGAPGPEQLVVDDAFDAAVASAVEALPLKMRRVLQLVDLDGLSYQEAAVALAVPVGTVMSRLYRARSRIRERLAANQVVPRRDT